ncbi:MAG: LEA type 2 family protein [Candidatus Aminicenantes bacterium]|nr:LEA type 2 family protein [Candidatus Aminicenantes bacterium]
MKKKIAGMVVVMLVLAGSSGCALLEQVQQRLAVQNCKFHFVDARAHSFSLTDLSIDLHLKVTNPNPISVIIDKLDLLFFINERETVTAAFGGGTIKTDEAITMNTTVRIPILKVGMMLVDIIRKKKKVTYKLEGDVYVNTSVGTFRFPVTILKSH